MTTNPHMSMVASALGRIPSGIYVLTARHGELETGMLASWVMQAGFEPPAISVAIARNRYLCDWLGQRAPFALCLVAEQQKTLLRHFAHGFAPGEPAFAGLSLDRDRSGVPILREGTIGHLSCVASGHVDSGDHRIFVANVTDARLGSEALPMVHHRKSGSHY